ncbi:MAG TPA: 7TM diverse intracellular signaling domain-containing protein [Leptospiraceae bacterium]|nr:7TM diverse intracellular signaling domain-containing protein [Leptospiraceae bacterium]
MISKCVFHFKYLFLILYVFSLSAEEGIPKSDSILIHSTLHYLEDKSRTLNLEEIENTVYQGEFKPIGEKLKSFGYTHSIYWYYTDYPLPINLENFLLEIPNPILDSVEIFYRTKTGEIQTKKVGRLISFRSREYENRNFLISLDPIPVGRIYFKVDTESSLQLPVLLWEKKTFFEKDQYSFLFQILFIGIVGAMFLYNSLLGISLKDKLYLYYILYLSSVSLFLTGINGLNAQLLFRDSPNLDKYSLPVLLSLNNLGNVLFAKSFLNLKNQNTTYEKIFRFLIGISFLFFLFSFLLSYISISRLIVFTAVINVSFSIYVAVRIALKGYRPAKIYLLAWGVFLFGAVIYAFSRFGFISVNAFTNHISQIGVAIEAIFISFALADRIKIIELEKEKAQAEMLVAVRQTERLKSELELAKRIQQSIIPKRTPNLKGLEIASWYRPMEILGGDFYDFRTVDGNLSCIIADVSGHGLPAALVVSTVKTAFWFQEEHINSPTSLLHNMNRILIDKSGGEFITACYLFIDIQNKILKTGNAGHNPLILYRKSTEELLTIRPSGGALAIFDNPKFLSEDISIQTGDRIIIYTDGLFEAFNEKEEAFGEDRIFRLLKENITKSPKDFGLSLMNEVTLWSGGEHNLQDDIALIVIDVL